MGGRVLDAKALVFPEGEPCEVKDLELLIRVGRKFGTPRPGGGPAPHGAHLYGALGELPLVRSKAQFLCGG